MDDRVTPAEPKTDSGHARNVARAHQGHVAMRTCIASRKVKPASELLRCVAQHSDDGTTHIVPDLHGRLPGRGAWLTPTASALEKAIEQRRFHRALRLGRATPNYEELWAVVGREGS